MLKPCHSLELFPLISLCENCLCMSLKSMSKKMNENKSSRVYPALVWTAVIGILTITLEF